MERLLLAVDGSDHSNRAAALAGELSTCLGATVDVVNVVPDRSAEIAKGMAYYGDVEAVYTTQREVDKAIGLRAAENAAKRVVDAGGSVGSVEVAIGQTAAEIVRAADAVDADAIVMGRRGHGDIGGLLMGSVSHKVAHLTSRTLITTG
jgi:nucleotide-binding universal stress UspA family protein